MTVEPEPPVRIDQDFDHVRLIERQRNGWAHGGAQHVASALKGLGQEEITHDPPPLDHPENAPPAPPPPPFPADCSHSLPAARPTPPLLPNSARNDPDWA